MTLDWAHFTPWSSLGGGLLIGLAAAVLILGPGASSARRALWAASSTFARAMSAGGSG